jgi:ferrous iron transport protein A
MFTLLFTPKTMKKSSPRRHPSPQKNTPAAGDALPLDKLPGGATGHVRSIGGGTTPLRQRLMEMGITVGSEIQVIRKAPFGGPIEISVRGYRLSLRRSEAQHILTEKRS